MARLQKARLLKLANLLEADAKNKKGIKFDLAYVAVKPGPDDPQDIEGFRPGEVPEVNCGTVACAVGLACVSGAFNRAGLTYRINGIWGLQPVYRNHIGWGAECEFFGLDDIESDFLFHKESYPRDKTIGAVGERYVAKRIRDFVAGKVSPPDSD